MRKIIYTKPDGGIAVIHPVRNTHPIIETLSDVEIEQRAWDRLPPEAKDAQFIEADQVPVDRTFRNAWIAGAGTVDHDMTKCREIHKEKLRQLRAPKLAALDVEYMRADEAGDATWKTEIAAKKKALRDVTKDPAITDARTADELKAVMPEVLK